MIKIYDLISNLNKEEVRNLSILLNRFNPTPDRKDLALLDFIKKNKENIVEENIIQKLYKNHLDKNSFYRLKNRLLNEVNKSLLLLHYNKSEQAEVLNCIVLSKLFSEKTKYKLAYNYLTQAETKAIKHELFDLLDLIYSELIKLSQESVEFNPLEYIEKRKLNHKNLYIIQEIDDLLAALIYRIKISQNYSSHNYQFTELLNKTIHEFIDNKEVQKSPKLQFKIYHSISRILLQHRDYKSLEEYLKLSFKKFSDTGLFNKSNHDTKLQMLTYLINSLFKNSKIEESLQVTQQLHAAMKEYDNLLYNKFLFYYYNSLVINYQVSDKKKAIEVLLEVKFNPEIQRLPFYAIFTHLNLAVLYFDTKNFKEARKNISKLKLTDHFKNMDKVFQFKVFIFELLTIFEIQDIDLFDYQLHIIQKDYKELLEKETYAREKLVIEILNNFENKAYLKDAILRFNTFPSSDSDIINYNDWLSQKIK